MKVRIPSQRQWNVYSGPDAQGIEISTLCFGQRVKMRYIGYSKREAMRLFRQHLINNHGC